MNQTEHCFRCGATYGRDIEWVYGYNTNTGTSPSEFRVMGNVTKGDCPMCRKPPQLEPSPELRPM